MLKRKKKSTKDTLMLVLLILFFVFTITYLMNETALLDWFKPFLYHLFPPLSFLDA